MKIYWNIINVSVFENQNCNLIANGITIAAAVPIIAIIPEIITSHRYNARCKKDSMKWLIERIS